MNIFLLSEELDSLLHYQQQAAFHADKHVVKMIAESTQMLVTSLSFHANYDSKIGKLAAVPQIANNLPCKPLSSSHMKHPCTEWTASSIINTNYVACLADSLVREHQYRYPLSAPHAYAQWIALLVSHLDSIGLGPCAKLPDSFVVVTKDKKYQEQIFDLGTAVYLYRNYYVDSKSHIASWKKRMKPMWYLLREELAAEISKHY